MFFFFNEPPTTEIYPLSLHDALPISDDHLVDRPDLVEVHLLHPPVVGEEAVDLVLDVGDLRVDRAADGRSEEHTSELQSRQYLVCRLLLEKKKKFSNNPSYHLLTPTL